MVTKKLDHRERRRQKRAEARSRVSTAHACALLRLLVEPPCNCGCQRGLVPAFFCPNGFLAANGVTQ